MLTLTTLPMIVGLMWDTEYDCELWKLEMRHRITIDGRDIPGPILDRENRLILLTANSRRNPLSPLILAIHDAPPVLAICKTTQFGSQSFFLKCKPGLRRLKFRRSKKLNRLGKLLAVSTDPEDIADAVMLGIADLLNYFRTTAERRAA